MELVILYLFLALSVSFLCSVLEAVLLSTPMSFITMKEKEGAKNASIMMKQKQNIDRPILSFNEDTLVSVAWEEMLKRKEHIAQVLNEFGCFLGVVTMEDIIETIIGREIVDESDTIVDLQAYAREKWLKQMK